jgi:hypothetical protein
MPITISFTGNTRDELYSSIAAFLDVQPTASPTAITAVSAAANTADDDEGPASTDAPEFDKGGIPWDKRIHSSSKALNEDGTWRKRRGVQDVFYASVMAELSNRTPGQQPTATPAAPVTASPAAPGIVDQGPVVVPPVAVAPAAAAVVPAPVMAAPTAAIPAVPSAPTAPAAPVAPTETSPVVPVAEPAPVAAGMGFDVLMPKVSAAIQAGKFTNEQLNTWVTTPAPDGWGLANITQLAADRLKTQQFHDWLKSSGLID